jgi:hypothetical protein
MNNFSRSRNGLKKPIFGVLDCGGGKFGARHAVDIHTFPFNQAALGDDQVDMQLKAQTTLEGVCSVDLANPDPGIDFINDLLHGLRPDPKQHFQHLARYADGPDAGRNKFKLRLTRLWAVPFSHQFPQVTNR